MSKRDNYVIFFECAFCNWISNKFNFKLKIRKRERKKERKKIKMGGEGKVGVSNDKVGGDSCNIWWISICHTIATTLSLYDQNTEWLNVVQPYDNNHFLNSNWFTLCSLYYTRKPMIEHAKIKVFGVISK